MCTDKPNIHGTLVEKYHGNQPIIISFNVEYISVIAYGIYTAKRIPYVIKIPQSTSLTIWYQLFNAALEAGCLWAKILMNVLAMMTMIQR